MKIKIFSAWAVCAPGAYPVVTYTEPKTLKDIVSVYFPNAGNDGMPTVDDLESMIRSHGWQAAIVASTFSKK